MCLIMTDAGWVNLGDAVVCVNDNNVEGVYRPDPQAKTTTAARADYYVKAVEMYLNGECEKELIYGSFSSPIYGAFGEKL